MRFPHRSLRHDQLLRPGRERVQGPAQVQPSGENAPALRTPARKETRRLKICLKLIRHVSTLFRHVGQENIKCKKVAKKDFNLSLLFCKVPAIPNN